MKRITMMSLAAATLLFVAGSSLAATTEGTRTPRVAERQVKQQARIEQGVKSGELTKPEARHLRHDQRHIQRMKQRAKADGVVTPRERERITVAQNRESKKIHRKKHNARTSK